MSEDGTRLYEVLGYRRTDVIMRVRAETAGEAIAKAQAGVSENADTEPGPDLHVPKWTARTLSERSPK